jgi:hypothetical protein
VRTIRKVGINISQINSKEGKLLETPPLSTHTPNTNSGKESLLIPTSKVSDKRLSFKEGNSADEVSRNPNQNNLVPRRSLVPRHSISMSPIK